MVGERLREARVARQLSLAEVAAKAEISAATLSRIERDKQAIDVSLFLVIARVLNAAPADLLGDSGDGDGNGGLAGRVAALQPADRTRFWRELNEERRQQRQRSRPDVRTLMSEVEQMLAQIDLLRDEIETVRAALMKRR
jgi:transcriptional regulator with XRE-family HTH domain